MALISTISVVVCIYDKTASKHPGVERIRERTLCTLALMGGGLCMLLTMLGIRHKTQHTAIMVIVGSAAVIWTLIYGAVAAVIWLL